MQSDDLLLCLLSVLRFDDLQEMYQMSRKTRGMVSRMMIGVISVQFDSKKPVDVPRNALPGEAWQVIANAWEAHSGVKIGLTRNLRSLPSSLRDVQRLKRASFMVEVHGRPVQSICGQVQLMIGEGVQWVVDGALLMRRPYGANARPIQGVAVIYEREWWSPEVTNALQYGPGSFIRPIIVREPTGDSADDAIVVG